MPELTDAYPACPSETAYLDQFLGGRSRKVPQQLSENALYLREKEIQLGASPNVQHCRFCNRPSKGTICPECRIRAASSLILMPTKDVLPEVKEGAPFTMPL